MRKVDFDGLCGILREYRGRKVLLTFHSIGDRDGVGSAAALSSFFSDSVVATPDFITNNAKKMLEYVGYGARLDTRWRQGPRLARRSAPGWAACLARAATWPKILLASVVLVVMVKMTLGLLLNLPANHSVRGALIMKQRNLLFLTLQFLVGAACPRGYSARSNPTKSHSPPAGMGTFLWRRQGARRGGSGGRQHAFRN